MRRRRDGSISSLFPFIYQKKLKPVCCITMDVDIVEEFLIQQLKLDSTEGEGSENKQKLANCNVLSIHKEFEDVKKVIKEKKRGTVANLREARRENLYYLLNVKADWLELSKKPHFLNLMRAKYNELGRRISQIKNKLEEETPKGESESRQHNDAWFPSDPNPKSYRWSSQAVELKKIHGFEDKGMIMERLLLKEGAGTKAVGIVGVAGVGKTALCQLAFNRGQVRNHFPLRIWLCFSNQSKLEEEEGLLVKRILSCLGFEDGLIGEVKKAGKLQLALQRQLKRGRYLIVLDDVWTKKEEADRKLFSFLTQDQDGDGSGHGGALIVTSRYEDLDQMLGPEISKHTLLPLADDDSCWNIFSDAVNKDGTVQLPDEMMSRKEEIVKKCEGLPLMAKMLGKIGHNLANEHRQTTTTN